MKKKRLIVGLTGTFGSGKSTVAQYFKRLGAAKVISADKLAHEVFAPGNLLQKKIRLLFDIKGVISRRAIAGVVFKDSGKRKKLEGIIHPYVFKRIREELRSIRNGIRVLEIPLLFETGAERLCDVTVAVIAGEHNIINRLSGKGFSRKAIGERLKAHFSEHKKAARADFIIPNKNSEEELFDRTKQVWSKLNLILENKTK
jgi:dephospho-CoA kinase